MEPKQVKWSKLPLAQREADVQNLMRRTGAHHSTLINNLISERLQSRRRKVRQNEDDQADRKHKQRCRMLQKLALKRMLAHKENLEREQNERQAKKENARNPRRRPRKKKGKSKASSQKKKMRPNVKNASPQEKGPRTQKSHP